MKIVINTIPPTINKYIGRTNVFEYQNDKKKMHKAVLEAAGGQRPMYESCKIKVSYFFGDARRRDPGNYDKMLLDGLVEAGIIVDDNYNVIKEYTSVGSIDRKNPRVEVLITEV